MKRPYNLDYSIERDVDRVAYVEKVIDTLVKRPTGSDLELLASYILYGKDEEGYNAVQRGEITDRNKRYNSYKKKDDKLLSLDQILDDPMADHQFATPQAVKVYRRPHPSITRPKYDKKTGEMIDPGDSVVPGMEELWKAIDALEHRIAIMSGLVPPDENYQGKTVDAYTLYRLRHTLIDIRRHQYYLKDSFSPTLHFQTIDRPKPQYIDWTGDCNYWCSAEDLRRKLDKPSLPLYYSRDPADYPTRINPQTGALEYKWHVKSHHFDWENPYHIRCLLSVYDLLYNQMYTKLDTYGRTLIFDFERYRSLTPLTPVREFLLDCKLGHLTYPEMAVELQKQFGLTYNDNHISDILANEIPQKLATTAKRIRLLNAMTPDNSKRCHCCGRTLPRDTMFFSRNAGRRDGWASNCKECEKLQRILKGGQTLHDRRTKDAEVYEMQAGQTRDSVPVHSQQILSEPSFPVVYGVPGIDDGPDQPWGS